MKKQFLLALIFSLVASVMAVTQTLGSEEIRTTFESSRSEQKFAYCSISFKEGGAVFDFKFGAVMPQSGSEMYTQLTTWAATHGNLKFSIQGSLLTFTGVQDSEDARQRVESWVDFVLFRQIFGGAELLIVNPTTCHDGLMRGPWCISKDDRTVDWPATWSIDTNWRRGTSATLHESIANDKSEKKLEVTVYYSVNDEGRQQGFEIKSADRNTYVAPYAWWKWRTGKYGNEALSLRTDLDHWAAFIPYLADLPDEVLEAYRLADPKVIAILRSPLAPKPAFKKPVAKRQPVTKHKLR